MTSTLVPTDEQITALDGFSSGLSMALDALAGTGKSSTLRMIGESAPGRRGQYLAFNSAIVREAARTFPPNVDCRTAHSLAFRAVAPAYPTLRTRLDQGRMRGDQIARELGIDPQVVTYGAQRKVLQPSHLAGHVMRAVTRFCQSADPEPSRRHVAYIDGLDIPDPDGTRNWDNNNRIASYLEPFLAVAWADLTDPHGRLRFSHDHYLKLYELSRPRLGVDFLLIDEAQDLSPVMLSIMEGQKDAQLVVVGDANQSVYCQPAGTRVRVAEPIGGGRGNGAPTWRHREVPIEQIQVGQRVVSWTGATWRLGSIRRSGSRVESITVKDYEGPLVRVTTAGGATSAYTPDHHCVAMLGGTCEGEWVTYMMRRGDQYRVGCCMGRYASQSGKFGPLVRAAHEEADAIWVLGRYSDKTTALGAEAALMDVVSGRCFKTHGGGAWWDEQPTNRVEATGVLVAYGLDIDAPLVEIGSTVLTSGRTPIVTQARNLLDGMLVLPAEAAIRKGGADTVRMVSWEPIKVTREQYAGPIYSLSVERDHTYVADGIVTHNSWRGSVNAMEIVDVPLRARLTQSFRFGDAVAEVANWCLGHLPTELRVRGYKPVDSRVGPVPSPRSVLCRTNAGAMDVLFTMQTQGRRPCLLGGGSQVASFARAAKQLMDTGSCGHPDLWCFDSWKQVVEYTETDPQGDELALLVKLVESYGVDVILEALDRMPDERAADVVIATAHAAKGREWESVRIHSDFRTPELSEGHAEEWRLLYVAVTRARLALDVSLCPAFAEFGKPAKPEEPALVGAGPAEPAGKGLTDRRTLRRLAEAES